MKHVLITGVSSGIGKHAAEHFLGHGWRVFGTVRNIDDARALEERFPRAFVKIIADVTNHQQVDEAVADVAEILDGQTLDLLINNAGIATFGPLMHIPIEVFEHQLRVNVTGLLKVTQACLPLLGARQEFSGTTGRIVNIGSVSGRFATPFLGPYSASKHALEAISDCLRRELDIYGIRVTLLQVASVRSEIWTKSALSPTYTEGTAYARLARLQEKIVARVEGQAMDPMVVTRRLWKIAERKKIKPRYLITRNNFMYRLFMLLPDSIADLFYRRGLRRLGLRPIRKAT